jgi:hypothetical protein
MQTWLIAAVPPVIALLGVFLYLLNVESRIRRAEEQLRSAVRPGPT